MRLIDADKLNIYDVSPAYGTCVMGITEEDIEFAPTVEAEPVRQGKWVGCTNAESVDYECKCSVCGYTLFNDFARNYKYCPNCGARMWKE